MTKTTSVATGSVEVKLSFKRSELIGIAMALRDAARNAMHDERFEAAATAYANAAKFYEAADYHFTAAESRRFVEEAREASRDSPRDQILALIGRTL